MKATIKKRGNGHVLYLPKNVRKALGWTEGTEVRIILTDDGIVLKGASKNDERHGLEEIQEILARIIKQKS